MNERSPVAEPVFVRSDAPPGTSGEWSLETFAVDEPMGPDGRPEWCQSPPGIYRRLKRGSEVFMTDLRQEWWTQRVAVAEACRRGGAVLVTGLGLGQVVESMLQTPGSRVEEVAVVELSRDVIALVGDHLEAKYPGRVRVFQGNAFAWRPPAGARYTVGWHDIWPNPHDAGRWPEMEALEIRYRRYCDWQGSWVREYLREERTADVLTEVASP